MYILLFLKREIGPLCVLFKKHCCQLSLCCGSLCVSVNREEDHPLLTINDVLRKGRLHIHPGRGFIVETVRVPLAPAILSWAECIHHL